MLLVTFNDKVVERLYSFAGRDEFSLQSPRVTRDDQAKLVRLGEGIIHRQKSDESIRGFKLNMLLCELLSLLYLRFVSAVCSPETTRSERSITMQIIGYI